MTNDTPRTTTTTVTPKQSRILREMGDEHAVGLHFKRPRPGCAGCLLSGALDGGEG